MIQDRKSTNDVKQAIDNISKNCEKYIASVSEALNITGSSPKKICHILNQIKEHEQMIIRNILDSMTAVQSKRRVKGFTGIFTIFIGTCLRSGSSSVRRSL